MDLNLTNKVVLVTGAGQGIGKCVAEKFAALGGAVAVNDINNQKVEEMVNDIQNQGGIAVAATADITLRNSVKEMFKKVRRQLGSIDILVNNAGLWIPKSFFKLDDDTWDQTFCVNLKGMFLCSQLAALDMKRKSFGRIINVASVAAKIPFPDSIHYGAAKSGVLHFTRSIALLLAPDGITVNAVAPGTTQTQMFDIFVNGRPERVQQTIQGNAGKFLPDIPKGRIATVEDQAALVLFLASDDADHITGQSIFVDGGQSL